MYEKTKSWIFNNRFLIGVGVSTILFLACYLFSHRTATTDDDITNTISRVEEHNQRAGEFADAARSELTTARTDVARTVENVERAERIVKQDAGTIKECGNLVSALKDRTREAKSIIADIEQSNKKAEGY